jgi:hypothetical protein
MVYQKRIKNRRIRIRKEGETYVATGVYEEALLEGYRHEKGMPGVWSMGLRWWWR